MTEPQKPEIDLSPKTAEAWDGLTCHVGRINLNLPDMAWLAFVLPLLPDDEQLFPRGKWASIQELNRQLADCAKDAARLIRAERGHTTYD